MIPVPKELSDEEFKEYRERYGRNPWQCVYCDKVINSSNKSQHCKSKRHELKTRRYS